MWGLKKFHQLCTYIYKMGNSPSAIKNMDDLSDEDLPIMLDCGHLFSNSSLNQLYDE